MKIFFSDKFKKELRTYGGYVKLSYFRLGLYSSSGSVEVNDLKNLATSEYMEFNSLYKDSVLSITLDINSLCSEKGEKDPVIEEGGENRTALYFYYNDINDNLVGLAFIIWGDGEKLNLCASNKRRDLNYINVHFPSDTIGNIETVHDAKFLECPSNIQGVNTFLAVEGEYENSSYITKDSYKKYIRNLVSLKNNDPLFLNNNGEKVFSITSYKHYKSIEINAVDLVNKETDGTKTYYIAGDKTASITGVCTYDLYEVSNDVYTLKQADCTEDIDSTTLYRLLADGTLSDGDDLYKIDQINKTITFSSNSDLERTEFFASLSFKSEIGDDAGKTIIVKSNNVRFITYLSWTVEYSTNLVQGDDNGETHALLLFDNTAGNGGWDIEGNNNAGTIIISSESNVKVDDIKFTPSNSIFYSYFDYDIDSDDYDSTNKKYRYKITITTKQKASGKDWYPLNANGSSELILVTVTIDNSKPNDKATFYCVQRVSYPLSLNKFQGGTWSNNVSALSFSGEFGLKSISDLYVCNSVEGYPYWEVEYNDENLYGVSQGSNRIVESTSVKPTGISSSAVYTRTSPSYSKKNLGTLTIKRNNRNNSYDKTNWKDLIYCSPSNNIVVNLTLSKKSDYTYDNRVDSATNYYYNNDGEFNRLYLFDRYTLGSPVFEIVKPNVDGDIPDLDLTYEDKDTFERYFDINVEKLRRTEIVDAEVVYIYQIYEGDEDINTLSDVKPATITKVSYEKINSTDGLWIGGGVTTVTSSVGDRTVYVSAEVNESNVDDLNDSRTEAGLVEYIGRDTLPNIESRLFQDVIVYVVSITPKEVSGNSQSDWYPKKTNNGNTYPIFVQAGDEKFYCVIKPDLADSIKFYSGSDLSEISSLKYYNTNEDQVDSYGTRRKYIYVGNAYDESSEFEYWYVSRDYYFLQYSWTG
jgi:hypothetical protein